MKKTKAVDREKFLKALNEGKKCYLKKPRSWQKVWYWWEIDKKNPDERWFMNIYKSEKGGGSNFKNPSWIIAKDLDVWLSYAENNGYKYYISE